jgi:hypothetical protein
MYVNGSGGACGGGGGGGGGAFLRASSCATDCHDCARNGSLAGSPPLRAASRSRSISTAARPFARRAQRAPQARRAAGLVLAPDQTRRD